MNAFHIVCASDYHQGDARFSEQTRGRQCVTNCLMFFTQILMNQISIGTWPKEELHMILWLGDFLYRELKQCDSASHPFLHPSNIRSDYKFRIFFSAIK